MIKSYVALDLETTGISPSYDRIIEIGAVRVIDGVQSGEISTFVHPKMNVPQRITEITGINDKMLVGAPCIEEILEELLEFIGDLPLLGHNILFDFSFIKCAAVAQGKTFETNGIDTLRLARMILPEAPSKRLSDLCELLDIDPGTSHRALDDARSAMILYQKLGERCSEPKWMDETRKLEFGIKKKSPITQAQIRYLKDLTERHHIVPEREIESMTKNEASRMIDLILSTYGRITSQ